MLGCYVQTTPPLSNILSLNRSVESIKIWEGGTWFQGHFWMRKGHLNVQISSQKGNLRRLYQRRTSCGSRGVQHPQCCNIAVLSGNFSNFNDTLVEQKIFNSAKFCIHNNYCRQNYNCGKNFDKFTKILLLYKFRDVIEK